MNFIKEIRNVEIARIDRTGRTRDDYGDIPKFWEEIKDRMLHPPVVKDLGNGYFKLIAGGRRIMAHIHGGQTEILCNITDKDLDEFDIKVLEIKENIERKAFSYAEEVKYKLELHNLMQTKFGVKADGPSAGHSLNDTARMLNESSATTSNDLQLAKMIQVVPELADMKNKSEAVKFMKQVGTQIQNERIVQEITQKRVETGEDEQRKKLVDSYIIGDFLKRVKDLPNEHFDLVECDPPYGVALTENKELQFIDADMENYVEIPTNEYTGFIHEVAKECFRVLKENSWMLCWFGPHPNFEIVYQALISAGFKGTRMVGIWHREHSGSQTMNPRYNLGNCYETFFYVRKGDAVIAKMGASNLFSYRPIPASKKIHRTQKPLSLYEDLLTTFTRPGSNILVPFLGSGSTLLAASNVHMTGIGYDLSQDFKNSYVLRVHAENPGSYGADEKTSTTIGPISNDQCIVCDRSIPYTSATFGTHRCKQHSDENM